MSDVQFHAPPTVFPNHLTLMVQDMEKQKQFYTKQLGMTVIQESETELFLGANKEDALLTLKTTAGVADKSSRQLGLFHVAFLLPNRELLGQLVYHLLENNYPVQGASHHLVSEAFYLADPEGNGIELYADRPAASWAYQSGQVVMTTERLDVDGLLAVREQAPFSLLPSHTRIGHLHFHVHNLEDIRHFYENGLGFAVMTTYGDQALFMAQANYHHHLAFNLWAGSNAPRRSERQVGMVSYSLMYPDEHARTQANASALWAIHFKIRLHSSSTPPVHALS
ncbi:LOW QUALITY PROTEIN: glyoxalase family protein [Geomicrobium sp. JCM 19039]|nr:LOW QUALITY PROTEIN: glyoxalase family protein [Geomicrobium sp. JCM 19039]